VASSVATAEQVVRPSRIAVPQQDLDDLRSRSCRAEAISAFLAVLEMARLGLVRLHQTKAGSVLLYRTAKELDIEALEGIHG